MNRQSFIKFYHVFPISSSLVFLFHGPFLGLRGLWEQCVNLISTMRRYGMAPNETLDFCRIAMDRHLANMIRTWSDLENLELIWADQIISDSKQSLAAKDSLVCHNSVVWTLRVLDAEWTMGKCCCHWTVPIRFFDEVLKCCELAYHFLNRMKDLRCIRYHQIPHTWKIRPVTLIVVWVANGFIWKIWTPKDDLRWFYRPKMFSGLSFHVILFKKHV